VSVIITYTILTYLLLLYLLTYLTVYLEMSVTTITAAICQMSSTVSPVSSP